MKYLGHLATLACASLLTSTVAQAHPGIHVSGLVAGAYHPFTGADHLLAALGVGMWAALLGGRLRWMLPAIFAAMVLGGALVGFAGVALPAQEPAIAISVVAVGLLVALQANAPPALAATLAGAFALAHGYAHGSEAPSGEGALAFGAGFMISTLILLACGVALGGFGRRPARYAGAATAAAGVFLVLGV